MRNLIQIALILVIKLYRLTLSRLLPASCRFTPTCSQYAVDAVKIHGPFKGSYLAFLRILRCNPFFESKEDRVPGAIK